MDENSDNNKIAFFIFASIFVSTLYLKIGGINIPANLKDYVTMALIGEPLVYVFILMLINRNK